MFRPDALLREWQVLAGLLRGMPRVSADASASERLAAFYGPQAAHYDAFRERLLHGRADLVAALQPPPGAQVVELGGGTGRNLAFFPAARRADLHLTVVDLCAPLLQQARERLADWPNARVVEADATHWQPESPVDCVFFSYALTMMDDWRGAIDNAIAMLRPGGTLGVVDFHVSSATPDAGLQRHGFLTRRFWPYWFGHDGVHLGPERLDCLRAALPVHRLEERRVPVPYLPGLRVPIHVFVGTKPQAV